MFSAAPEDNNIGKTHHLWQQQGTNFQGVNCPSQDCISIWMCRLFTAQGRRTNVSVFFTLITTFQIICLISWPWCTPQRGSSARNHCTWWGGWGWPASSPSAVGTWPGRCGGTAPCSHGTGWPAPCRCCLGRPPQWSWRAHPLLQHNTGHTLLDVCKIFFYHYHQKFGFCVDFYSRKKENEGPSTNVTSVTLSNTKQNAAKTDQTGGSVQTSVTRIKCYEISATFTVKMWSQSCYIRYKKCVVASNLL